MQVRIFTTIFFAVCEGLYSLLQLLMFWCFNKQSHALMPSWLLLKMQKRWSIIQTANFFTTATNVSTGLFIAYNNNIWQQNVSTIILESYCFFSSSVQARLSSKCLSFMYMPSFYYPSLILSIAIVNSFHFFATTNFLEIEIFECPRETLKSLYSVLYA